MSDAEPPAGPCEHAGCDAGSTYSVGHWDNERHLTVNYYCAAHAPPEATSFDEENDGRPGAYVDVHAASARSGLPQEYIRWVCDCAADAETEGEFPVVRHTIDAAGILKVYLNDIVLLAGVMAESKITPTIPRRRPGG
jgi:hypothetical protein